jgi:hypothetical protein
LISPVLNNERRSEFFFYRLIGSLFSAYSLGDARGVSTAVHTGVHLLPNFHMKAIALLLKKAIARIIRSMNPSH